MNKFKKIINSTGALATMLMGSATLVAAQTIDPPAAFFGNVGDLINSVLTFVVAIAALLVFLYLIWGGIDWITSGGDKGKTEAARNKITAAVVGLIILAAAYAILTIALGFLAGGSDLNGLLQDANII